TQKDTAGGGRNLDRVAEVRGQKVDRRCLVVDAGSRHQGGDNLAPRPALAHLVDHPAIEQFPAQVVAAGRSVIGEHIAPVAAPVDRKIITSKKSLDQLVALARSAVGKKRL